MTTEEFYYIKNNLSKKIANRDPYIDALTGSAQKIIQTGEFSKDMLENVIQSMEYQISLLEDEIAKLTVMKYQHLDVLASYRLLLDTMNILDNTINHEPFLKRSSSIHLQSTIKDISKNLL